VFERTETVASLRFPPLNYCRSAARAASKINSAEASVGVGRIAWKRVSKEYQCLLVDR
jgi:hypothetical protein